MISSRAYFLHCLPSKLAVVGSLPAYIWEEDRGLYKLTVDWIHSTKTISPAHRAQEHLSSGGCSPIVLVHPQPSRQSTTTTLE